MVRLDGRPQSHTAVRRLGAVLGAGPKGISVLIELQRRMPGQFVGIEAHGAVSSWDSAFAGTSSTRTGMDHSDTLVPGPDVPWTLREFARLHPDVTPQQYARNKLPKEVLQDYYRLAVDLTGVELCFEQPILSIARSDAGFVLRSPHMDFIVKYLIVATGPVQYKAWPTWVDHLDPEVYAHSIGHGMLTALEGARLVVVGGGHATPDIACRMWELGARVTVVIRKPALQVNYLPYPDEFIAPATWLCYQQKGVSQKVDVIEHVHRTGPWVTPQSYQEFVDTLELSKISGRPIDVRFGTRVLRAQMDSRHVLVEFSDEQREHFDRVVCATGFRPDVQRLPFEDKALLEGKVALGLPMIRDDYSFPGIPSLYFIGHLAALGPRGVVENILHYSQYATKVVVNAIAKQEGFDDVPIDG